MRNVVVGAALVAVVAFQGAGSAASAGSEPTQLGFQACPNITQTIYQNGQLLFTCSASNPNGLSGNVSLTCK